MSTFRIETTNDIISGSAGIALVGEALSKEAIQTSIDSIQVTDNKKEYKNFDILKTYTGMLCMGKVNYEDIDKFKDDEYFRVSLKLKKITSKETLRQRLEDLSEDKTSELCIEKANIIFLKRYGKFEKCCLSPYIPIDFDVTPFDNSGSKKEGVSRTYKQTDGYAPMITYIGGTGYMLNNEFREGSAHSNCEGTSAYIKKTLEYARQILPKAKLLCRFDSGNESVENISVINDFKDAAYLIKKNFRRESIDAYISIAKSTGCEIEKPRNGKVVYINSCYTELSLKNAHGKEIKKITTRLVVRYTERTIDKKGQMLMLPDQEVDAWYTSLPDEYSAKEVIAFYKDHGTSEQFHSEFKTDMDMERLPSGKFATNSLILKIGMLAFNILRAIGQATLSSGYMKRKRSVDRIRIKTVLQDIMYMACKYMIKFKQHTIQFAAGNIFSDAFRFVYVKFATG
jgi:hypothetical protein